jgi:outer membrane protein assembly factor BamB
VIRSTSTGKLLAATAAVVALAACPIVEWVRADSTLTVTPAQAATAPAGLIDQAAVSDAQIYVDDSFKAQDILTEARRYESQHQSQLAIQKYQDVVDQFGQKIIHTDGDAYISMTDYVRARLLAMPSVQQGQYDQTFGPQATKLINAMLAQRDAAGLLKACDRYFPSTAAVKGLGQLAQWYFEVGDFASAARVWGQLLAHPLAKEMTAELLHHAALVEKLAGHDEASRKLRDRLHAEFPDATGTVAGESVKLCDSLDRLLADAQSTQWTQPILPADEWPTFQGSASHSLVTDVNSSAGAKLWWVNYAPEAPANGQQLGNGQFAVQGRIVFRNGRQMFGEQADASMGEELGSFPVISGGTIYLHTGDTIRALSSSAGTSLWKYPEQPTRQDPNMYGFGGRATNHDSCSVFEGVVFAVLPGGRAAGNTNGRYYGPIMNNRLVAMDRTDGKVLWEKASAEISRDLEKDFPKLAQGALSLVGSPVVTQSGIFVIARKFGGDAFTQLYLVRLDRQTGHTNWGCYISSSSNNNYYGYGMPMGSVALLSVVDDAVYVSTGQGADCAIDANSGRINWLNITEGAKANRSPENYYSRMQEARAWRFNPPLVAGDKLITAEMGSKIRVYNRFTGKVLRTIDPKSIGDASIACGVIGDVLYTVGAKACATDVGTGEVVWASVDLGGGEHGKVMGRPFLAEHGLYMPFEKGLLIVDTQTGKQKNFSQWPEGENSHPGKPGNLLVTSEQIIVANDTELAGYSRWETALANREKAISEHAGDPKPYLSLAEIAFRTGHWDLSKERMKQAVDIAVDPQSKTDAEFVTRLYRTNLNFGEQLLAKSDAELRTRSRFYYECCKATARDPETQAEWRLCLAVLAVGQNKFDEAAALYNEVLADPALRGSAFHRNEALTRAGVTAEVGMRTLIEQHGRDEIYKPYEAQAVAALAKARAAGDAAALQNVLDAYPNAMVTMTAAAELAAMYAQKQDLQDQIRTLRWLYQRSTVPQIKAQATADLARAHVAIKRYAAAVSWAERGQRQFPDFMLADNGRSIGFKQLCEELRANVPTTTENRRPSLPEPVVKDGQKLVPLDISTAGAPIADGILLSPLEVAPVFRRPDALFVSGGPANPSKISMYSAATLGHTAVGQRPDAVWSIDLADADSPQHNMPLLLLGCSGKTAVFISSDVAVAVDTEKGAIKWKAPFEMSEEEFARYTDQANRIRMLAQQQQQQGLMNGAVVFNGDDNNYYANNPMVNLDAEQIRTIQTNAVLGKTRFTSLRLLGTRMLAVVGNRLVAYNIGNGKKAWPNPVTLPDGLPGAVVGNDEMLVVQVDNPDKGTPTFVAIDADTGKWRGTLKLDDERVLWRQLSEDGTLFVVSDQAVSAYDMHGELSHPLWKRVDLRQLHYPYASTLSLDGLLVINNNNELVCLPQEGGEPRWQPIRLQLPTRDGNWMALRSAVDGDNVIYMCTSGCEAYNTNTGRLAWAGSFMAEKTPPLVAGAMADPYLVVLGNGQLGTTQRAASLFCIDRRGGKLCLTTPLYRSGPGPDGRQVDPEGPRIHSWQVIDNAVLLEIDNRVYTYRTTPVSGK